VESIAGRSADGARVIAAAAADLRTHSRDASAAVSAVMDNIRAASRRQDAGRPATRAA
jgi:hypothetical protein